MLRTLAFALAAAALSAGAFAAPPPDADMSLAPWFRGLRQPGTGMSCCSIADCRRVDYEITPDGYVVRLNGMSMPVPPERVLHRMSNPTGRGVACYTPDMGIMCFVPADGV